ncbi:neutral and basic amino acid transport protein rBAT isoform X2 [Diprion similis]|uniref:neutral and basic amino acid transport protein rBAT isoform X2 n=1 Tax=Diprion similis TaxID=362088 RepID=UPI001EF853C4|nr:neutral and basic amino acid transport protein rBAT isoform X2 [Diprion similis]
MESGKLDIDNVVKDSKEPVPTYKPISEDDSILAAHESKGDSKMAKQNGDTDIDDGAEERMLKDTGKINSNKDATEVKFISENGDAKIDIKSVKHALTGMGKEELMKFANDPFWIRLRWFMFIAFWLLWAAMLAGAIVIIIGAPKCPGSRKVWEENPIVRLEPSKIPNGLKGLLPVLNDLKNKHIKLICLASIMKSENEATVDFKDIDPKLGNMADFTALVETAKKNEIKIILEVDPNHTSKKHPWFIGSLNKTKEHMNYYVWVENKTDSPNNWVSTYNKSAWTCQDGRCYLHQHREDQPDLNYRNPKVVHEFSEILIHWLKLGVIGFRLANTQYLLEDEEKRDEKLGTQVAPPNTYPSYNHAHTFNLNENRELLRQWRDVVANYTDNEGLFSLQENIGNDTLTHLNDNGTIVDLPQRCQFLSEANANISANDLEAGFKNASSTWSAWDLNNPQRPLHERMPVEVAESLTLMTLLLPGTPILSINQTQYNGTAFSNIIQLRHKPSFTHGVITHGVFNGTVFAYTMLKSGNLGYLVAYHSGNEPVTVDLSELDRVPEKVRIIDHSSNYKGDGPGSKVSSNAIYITPKSTLVAQYTAKSS